MAIATCPDCARQWRDVDSLPDVEVYSFPDPPHRLVVWRCVCGAELGVWCDRDGNPVSELGKVTIG